ncbi:MAG: signal recognition particle receptor subunit alpha, partial [Pyrinomonadaceae bacterium]
MGLFWRRKGKDQFLTLGLNEPQTAPGDADAITEASSSQPTAAPERPAALPATPPIIEPAVTGAGPTPIPVEHTPERPRASETPAAPQPGPPQKTVPTRSPFATSVLGLNLSIEELQAQEAALEQEFSARFRRAVAATRETLSERLDTVFQGYKQIDENLLDELEEALIAADIGVATTQHILETVRRGIARKQIGDLDALKQAIKNELLRILRASEDQGVASETSAPEDVVPYVMMIVGVNGVGKTTTIGKLAQRIKAEGNDVLICAADTFRAAAS